MNERPLLSLCIPIYNRVSFLNRMLSRFLEDKVLFEHEIELIISDNCSEDDLASCVEMYQGQGLRIRYHRQSANIGSDGNFKTLFGMARGQYCWLLGSDDIPVKGFLPKLVAALRDSDYGVLHIKCYGTDSDKVEVYDDHNRFVETVNYYLTFMSANIFRSGVISNVPLEKYEHTWLIQVPVYLESCFAYHRNAIFEYKCFEKGGDAAHSGGYNFLRVFVENFFYILAPYVERGVLSKKAYQTVKRIEYTNFVLEYFVGFMLTGGSSRFQTDEMMKIMWRHYGCHPYAYGYLIKYLFNFTHSYIKRKIWHRV